MTDNQSGQRQQRMDAYEPVIGPVPTLLSDDARQYVDQVAALQSAAAADEVLSGRDALRRLRGSDG
jgi:hypothetical protein